MIPQRNISIISNTLVSAGGRRIPEDRLQRLWTARLAHQICQLPPFDDVFREVLRAVRAADLPKAGG